MYYYTPQYGGESRTQRFLRETWNANENGAKRIWDTYSQEYIRLLELEHQQLLAQHKVIKDTYDYLTSDEFLSTDIGIVAKSTINGALINAGYVFITTIPVALTSFPASPGIALATLGKAAAKGFVEGAITGFLGGLLEIL